MADEPDGQPPKYRIAQKYDEKHYYIERRLDPEIYGRKDVWEKIGASSRMTMWGARRLLRKLKATDGKRFWYE